MIQFGAFGYLAVAALYLLLVALLLTVWRGQRVGTYLIAACIVSAAWAGLLAVQTGRGPIQPWLLFFVEILRSGMWILFLTHLLGEIGVSRPIRWLANIVWLGVMAAGLGVWAYATYGRGEADIGEVLFPGGLAAALTGLISVEQLYRNSPPESRWSLKLLLIGLGGMFAYDLFLYSQAILFDALDEATWLARGPVNLIFVPLIAVATRRNRDWQLRIFVSRHVVFYSTTLTAVGAYLLLMSVGGYLITSHGGSWGGVAKTVFFVGAGIVLFSLLFSSTLRAKSKVFLSKHFFQNKYDYREEWLGLISTLSKFEGSSTREVVVAAMAQIVDSPSGFLWMLDEDQERYRLAASFEAEDVVPDISADDSVIRFIRKDGWVVDLAEYAREPDLYGDMELPDWVHESHLAWLFVPLMYGKQLLAVVLLHQAPGPPKLNFEDRDLLKTVGNHIAVHLAQERSARLLAEARQFETYNRLTAFLMHDLNNLIAQQSLIVSNAEKHRRNPEFVDDAIQTITNSVDRMKGVMMQLKQGDAERVSKSTAAKFIVSAAVDRCAAKEPVPRLNIVAHEIELPVNAEELTMVLTHLIGNAQDATPPDGTVEVRLQANGDNALISIEDSGSGMSLQFIRDRLFRPFDSTKGVQGMGIGAYQAREFARKLGGDLQVESEVGRGTVVTMSLPVR